MKHSKRFWTKNNIAEFWKRVEKIRLPKEEHAETLQEFRIISLLDIDGKVFLDLRRRGLTRILQKYIYMDILVQKSGIACMLGCLKNKSDKLVILQ